MRKSLFILFCISITVSSCQKDEEEMQAEEIVADAIEDNAEFENALNGVENVSVDASDRESDSSSYEFENCASITVTPSWLSGTFPKTIVIDFGDSNCLGTDGNYRRGKVNIILSGPYRDSGTTITTTLDNYYQNDNKIEATKTKTNLGRNGTGNIVFDVVVENGLFTSVNNYKISWRSNRTVEWIDGENTVFNIFDDEYEIDGAANGVTRNGNLFTMDILENLNIKLNCRWIRSGKISIVPENFSARTVDYGNGNCDRLATYTTNGKDYQFSMR
ncbi:MAG: hypothetical protein RJQ00_03175 [Vicingaceae bacterium]